VNTNEKDEEGRFKWDVYDMAGILMNKGETYTFDEDHPISMHEEEDSFSESDARAKEVLSELRQQLKAAKAARNDSEVKRVQGLLDEFKKLEEEIQDYKDQEKEAVEKLGEHAQKINEMSLETLRENFYVGLQNIAWINHQDHYTVELNPESRPKKPKKNRIARWTEREHHILLTRNDITEEWQRIHRGGTHASPMPHLRRGHYKTLRADRYKEARGKRIWVRATHVNGECVEWRNGAISYKVI
jgi:hypothetical protein